MASFSYASVRGEFLVRVSTTSVRNKMIDWTGVRSSWLTVEVKLSRYFFSCLYSIDCFLRIFA